ncbi:DUF2267 domain-containing protein [Geodermatophilus ruber]|uniref:Uncharacterized conserved protein, DUF2267 family n=1 Tax=Geodermatophilus ruber TaxID=504800 RepID=A0A1I4K4W3_9ACTN|nr:DUF2267 domain-containing protein [Geodermatophilus ruber]SFL73814.1 Uncharacterized conserved protein, DUF2267 family [Geodermatophilus ruber]
MEYEEFIERVAERAGVSREHAAKLTEATLKVLADRISGGEDLDLAAMLPDELARHLRRPHQKQPKKYGFDEFVGKVRDRADGVPRKEIRPGIRAVLLTLREVAGEKEFRDALAQLPHEFEQLLQEEGAPEAASGDQDDRTTASDAQDDRTTASDTQENRTAASDAQDDRTTASDDQDDRTAASGSPGPRAAQDALVRRTAERAGVSKELATTLTRATLEVLGDRIGAAAAHDLAERLSTPSARWLEEPPGTPAHNYGPDGFVSRVRERAIGVADDDVTPGIQAVMVALREAVGEAEVEIALQQLTDEYDVLVRVS